VEIIFEVSRMGCLLLNFQEVGINAFPSNPNYSGYEAIVRKTFLRISAQFSKERGCILAIK
jgi:hypothetical protein